MRERGRVRGGARGGVRRGLREEEREGRREKRRERRRAAVTACDFVRLQNGNETRGLLCMRLLAAASF